MAEPIAADNGCMGIWPTSLVSMLALFLLTGCASELKGPNSLPSSTVANSDVCGKWIVVGDTSGRGDTGTLQLDPDGTFTMNYKMKGSKAESADGTYAVKPADGPGSILGKVEVLLTIKNSGGKPVHMKAPLPLYYDSAKGILQDGLTVAFARPR